MTKHVTRRDRIRNDIRTELGIVYVLELVETSKQMVWTLKKKE